ncbi:hypothetical protein NMG60_11033568 [Bertholletia excelsa]
MKVLKDKNENMIGICGMGGVGKTTMAKEIIIRVQQEKLFDDVVMATISKPRDTRKIQGDIADCLGMKLNAEGTDGRARELSEKMKQGRRIFVVLDDIWEVFELSDIGIPFGKGRTGCKILLTSRSKEVVEGMGATTNKFVPQVLTVEEAWSLFKEKAGIPRDETGVPPNLLSKRRKVAKECGGLPLAIVCVAAALKGKGEYSWDYALLQLRHSLVDVAKKVHMSLEFSYNQIASEEVQRCFLLCSMYPEDFDIPLEDLALYGFAMNFFKAAKKVDHARVATISIINTLKECYLLMDSNREEHVKMHDVIRDVAISIASNEEHPFMKRCDEALEDQLNEEKYKSYPIISVECSSRHKLPSKLELPKLSLFRLVNHDHEILKIPDSFYQEMQNLKVIDLCNIIIDSFPVLLGCLSGLHALSLKNCVVHGNMSIIGKMKSLEILVFRGSTMEELPIEMGQLTQLKLLDLYYCRIERIPPGVLSSLSNLEELYVGKVKGALLEHMRELSSLSNLEALDISLDCNELWPMNWTLESLKKFGIRIGFPRHVGSRREWYMSPNALYVKGIDVPNIMESGLRMPLKNSKQLRLSSIRGLNNDFCEQYYECLTKLELRNCENIEYLINAASGNSETSFPMLKSLTLGNLKNFKQIYQVQSQKDSLSKVKVILKDVEKLVLSSMDNLMEIWPKAFHVPLKLRRLRIEMCPLMNGVLLPFNWIQCGLKEIYVEDCQSVEDVFDLQIFGHPYSIVVLPMLDELKVRHLPKLIHVWKIYTISPVSFQGFQSLQSIEIKGCDNLRNLFPTYVAKLLQNLKKLIIEECGAMENIVANEPEIHDHHGEGTSFSVPCLFPQLKFLFLFFLPKLRSLCPQGFTFAGTCLESYHVLWCPNIEQHHYKNEKATILPGPTNIYLLNRKFVSCSNKEILVDGMDQDTWYKDVEVQTYLGNARFIYFLYCERLLSIVSSNLMGRLHKLEVMLVGWCDSVEAIFDFEGFDHEELPVSLPSELDLVFLPKLIHIWKIVPQQNYYHFSRLTRLKVESCDSLRYIFTISMAKALVTLSRLVIKRCKNIEKIVATCERQREDEEPVQFFCANCLVKLKCLPNLICFGPEEDCSRFLIAENLDITVIFCRKYKGPGDINGDIDDI